MKIEPFNGDVTTFQRFRNTFTYNVENWTEDPTQRLTHLYNNLQGTPKSLILNCFNVPAEEGYALAWEVLCKHYMKADELCNAFISKLLKWKDIAPGDSEGLLTFAAYLMNVKTALGAQYVRLELEETVTKILSKLPHYA